ncbi:hypothetical protein Ancab_005223 [Ancistrocladus abbreviatus]
MMVQSFCTSNDTLESSSLESCDVYYGLQSLWPKKRRLSERDAAFGLNTSVGLGAYLGIMGSRRDVVTAVWKTGLEGVWYKCIRCLRQTSAFASPGSASPANQNDRELWWIGRWAYGCPMCGGDMGESCVNDENAGYQCYIASARLGHIYMLIGHYCIFFRWGMWYAGKFHFSWRVIDENLSCVCYKGER